MTWCWIIPVIVGLISALLGYLLDRAGKSRVVEEWSGKVEAAKEEVANMARKVTLLEIDLAKSKESETEARKSYEELIGRFNLLQREWDRNRTDIQNLKEENAILKKQLKDDPQTTTKDTVGEQVKASDQIAPLRSASGSLFDAELARSLMGYPVVENDLTVIEGIGPKIRDLFHEHGITTWQHLAQTSVDRCREILRAGGDRFNQHDPGTWPQQAALAERGEWSRLKMWQDELTGGK